MKIEKAKEIKGCIQKLLEDDFSYFLSLKSEVKSIEILYHRINKELPVRLKAIDSTVLCTLVEYLKEDARKNIEGLPPKQKNIYNDSDLEKKLEESYKNKSIAEVEQIFIKNSSLKKMSFFLAIIFIVSSIVAFFYNLFLAVFSFLGALFSFMLPKLLKNYEKNHCFKELEFVFDNLRIKLNRRADEIIDSYGKAFDSLNLGESNGNRSQ